MSPGVTRRELLRKGGVVAAIGTAGCLEGELESMHQTLRAEQSTILEPAQMESSTVVEAKWQDNLDLDGTEIWVQDAVALDSRGTLLGGSVDGRPFVAQLSAIGETEWARVINPKNEKATFESLTRVSTGDVVAAGWSGWNGLVARVTTTGEIVWQRTLAPGPDNYQFKYVRRQGAGRVLVIGERTGGNNGGHRNSAWIVSLTTEGAVDWHRFYSSEIWNVNDIVVPSEDRYLLGVWKQTSGSGKAYDSVISINHGVQAWEHVYPGLGIDTLAVRNPNQYYFSATGYTASSFDFPDSVIVVGLRKSGRQSFWYRKLVVPNGKIIESHSVPVDGGLLTICNGPKLQPMVARITWDGTVGKTIALDIKQVAYVRRVSSRSLLLVSESNQITKVEVEEDP